MEAQLLDKIEAYLNGQLSPQEEKQFDAEIEQNPELAAAVDNFSLANDAVELLIEDNLRKELHQLRMEESANKKVISINKNKGVAKMPSLRSYLAAAASIAVLIGFLGLNWVDNNYSNEALLTGLNSEFEMPNSRDNTLHPFVDGFTAYQEGNLSKAIQFFQNVVIDDPRYAEAQFYLGHALNDNKDFIAAAAKFKNVATLNDIRFTEKAEWNQVLALLAAGQTNQEFQTVLSKIIEDENHIFNKKAVQLQTNLNSFWRKLVI